MGVKLAVLAAASLLSFVQGRAQPDGGYAEPNGGSTVALTATPGLPLRAAGAQPSPPTRPYLPAHENGRNSTEPEPALKARAGTGRATGTAPGPPRRRAH